MRGQIAAITLVFALPLSAQEADVVVNIDGHSVPLSTATRWSSVSSGLPKPGVERDGEGQEHGHDSQTLCYYHSAHGSVRVLRLFDSNMGMHSAELVAEREVPAACEPLDQAPSFTVDGVPIDLRAAGTSLHGFSVTDQDGVWKAKREWWFLDKSRQSGFGGSCFSASVWVTVVRPKGSRQGRVEVMNLVEGDASEACGPR